MTLAKLLLADRIAAIDHKMADSILAYLKFTLQDLSLEYGDVAIGNGEITHQLYYGSVHSSCTILGYIYCDNGVYYTDGKTNWNSPEQAALTLLNPAIVEDLRYTIQLERAMTRDYD